MVTVEGLMAGLWIAVAIILIVVLWNIVFIVVSLRTIVKRFDAITKEVEGLILKPISVADTILKNGQKFLEHWQQQAEKKAAKKAKKSSKKGGSKSST